MDKLIEMQRKLTDVKLEAQALFDAGDYEGAQAKISTAKLMKQAIADTEELEKDDLETADKANAAKKPDKKDDATVIRAMIKKLSGKALTQKENALLLPNTENPNGENGEAYILPVDVSTLIRRKIREYRSLREVVGYMPAGALSGSFPVENFETVTELIDFTDGDELKEDKDINFTKKAYSLKEKGALIALSNTLLKMTDENLINYVAEIFAKKAVITENKMIAQKMKEGKTVKALADWRALKSSINKDLDPAVLSGTVIVTNQDGFDILDGAEDANGRPLLQPNPADATRPFLKGYIVHVYSNTTFPSAAGKAPVFYGNLAEAIKFLDYNGLHSFAASEHAGFTKNTTLARIIEFIDVMQVDSSDKCYCYGELPLVAEAAPVSK